MLLSSNYREEKEAALALSTCGEGDRNTPCHHITRAAFLSALDGLAREGEPHAGFDFARQTPVPRLSGSQELRSTSLTPPLPSGTDTRWAPSR